MATPASGVTIRPELGQGYLELDLMAHLQGFRGMEVMPLMPSQREAGVFPKITLENLKPGVQLSDLVRGPDGSYARDQFEYTSDNFTCIEYGKEEVLDEREARILDNHGIVTQQVAADRATSIVLEALERKIASTIYDATTYAAQFNNVTNEWDDATNATPITDVKQAIERFEERNGFGPNTLIMNRKQARNVLLTDQVQTVLGYRPSIGAAGEQLQGNVAADVLASVLGMPRVIIADGFRNTSLPGAAASLSRIWSDEYVALLSVADGMDLKAPSFGRVFAWTGEGGAAAPGGSSIMIEQYFEPRVRSDVLRARIDIDVKVIHGELLELLGNITT